MNLEKRTRPSLDSTSFDEKNWASHYSALSEGSLSFERLEEYLPATRKSNYNGTCEFRRM